MILGIRLKCQLVDKWFFSVFTRTQTKQYNWSVGQFDSHWYYVPVYSNIVLDFFYTYSQIILLCQTFTSGGDIEVLGTVTFAKM